MYCVRCGRQVEEADRFCPSCGSTAAAPATMMPSQRSFAGHVRLLGILWIALSAFRLLPGLLLARLFQFGFPFPGGEHIPFFMSQFLHFIGLAMMLGGIAGAIVGIGLLQRQSWARMGALVLGGINLFDMPFGTALGIYTLWVLLPADHEHAYVELAREQAHSAAL